MTDFMVHIACWTLSLLAGSYAGEHVSVEIEQLETHLLTQKSISTARQLVHHSLPVATMQTNLLKLKVFQRDAYPCTQKRYFSPSVFSGASIKCN